MDNLLVLRIHRPEREAVFELRTKFAAAKGFKTTLLCILIFHYYILYVKLIVLNIVRPRPDISFFVELAVCHRFPIGTCILSR